MRLLLVAALLALASPAAAQHATAAAPGIALPPIADLSHAPIVLPVPPPPADPAVVLSPAQQAQAVIAGVQAGLEAARAGIQASPQLRSWSETTAGQAVLGCLAGALVITSAAAAGLMVAQAAR